MKTTKAYSDNIEVKNHYIRQFNGNIKADNLIRGSFQERSNSHWKGCAITCMLNPAKRKFEDLIFNHSAFETEAIQFPEWFGLLIDAFHERTSSIEFSQKFQVRLLRAIPVGFTDWQIIQWKFLKFVLESIKENSPVVVQPVIDLLDRAISGENVRKSEWSAARYAARSAAASAGSAAASAEWSAAQDSFANHLCELFEEAKI